ncbi:MAG: methylated-DNA--[protein]-cysteine S-methyltransferase [bacterium]|nr:methylated-DNA--[protein]-cysteine S-methyltransferase [bacterium]
MIKWMTFDTQLGEMILAANRAAIIGAWFAGQRHFDGAETSWAEDPTETLLVKASGQLSEYFTGRRRSFDLPLAAEGTKFQRRVWAGIGNIEYGQTTTYGTLARALDKATAARAVGAATGRNPLSIFVPCHRVLGSTGTLTGYAGGIERKRALLALEQSGLPTQA